MTKTTTSAYAIGLALLAGLVLWPFKVIGPGERGVSVSFGQASQETLGPGMYLKIPLVRGIKTMNVQIQKTEVDATAATRDLQETQTHVALNWHVSPVDVPRLYTEIGDADDLVERLIVPTFNEVLKQATAKMTAEEVLTKRMQMKTEVDKEMAERLKKYGVFVDEVNIVNVKFGQEFTKAIEEKQVAEQEAKKAHYVALQAEQEAIAEVNKAKGQAEAQRLLRATVDNSLLRLKAVEKWDGRFPQVMGTGTLPFINITPRDDGQ